MTQFQNTRLNEEQSWWGRWWLPDSPDEVRSGPLRYDGESNFELTIGPGFPVQEFASEESNSVEAIRLLDPVKVIHGLIGRKPVSLLGGYEKNARSDLFAFSQGPDEQTISAPVMVVGKHICSEDDELFQSISIEIEGLTSFLEFHPHSLNVSLDNEWEFKATTRSTIETTVNGNRYSFATILGAPYPRKIKAGAVFQSTMKSIVWVEYQKPASLREIRSTVLMLQRLVALAMYSSPAVFSVEGKKTQNDLALPSPILMKFPGKGLAEEPLQKSNELLFAANTIDFQILFENWVALLQKNLTTYNVLFGFRYSDTHFIESEIVALATALESISSKYKIYDFNHDLIENRKKKTIYLADRIYGVVNQIPDRLRIYAVADPIVFVDKVRKSRNGISHENSSKSEPRELFAIAAALESVLIYWTAVKIGIGEEDLMKSLPYNRRALQSHNLAVEFFSPS